MANAFISILKIFFNIFKWVLVAVGVALLPILIMCGIFTFYYIVIKKQKFPKRTVPRTKMKYSQRRSAFKRLYYDFPKRIIQDKLNANPDGYDTYGVHVFAGEQGSGKTVAAMHFAKMLKERNPASKIASNIDLNYQDSRIHNWEDILDNNNGELGQAIIIDEIQNWFNSMESRNFPPEMLTEITQQRKQRKCVIGTSQVFTRIAKPIREQITFLYRPITIMHCLTIVRVYKCDLKEDGTINRMRMRNCYFFVHDDELRTCYDTYEKVQRLSQKGFVPRSEQYGNTSVRIEGLADTLSQSAKP